MFCRDKFIQRPHVQRKIDVSEEVKPKTKKTKTIQKWFIDDEAGADVEDSDEEQIDHFTASDHEFINDEESD